LLRARREYVKIYCCRKKKKGAGELVGSCRAVTPEEIPPLKRVPRVREDWAERPDPGTETRPAGLSRRMRRKRREGVGG